MRWFCRSPRIYVYVMSNKLSFLLNSMKVGDIAGFKICDSKKRKMKAIFPRILAQNRTQRKRNLIKKHPFSTLDS